MEKATSERRICYRESVVELKDRCDRKRISFNETGKSIGERAKVKKVAPRYGLAWGCK
jgi:hypothetical protein